MCLGLDESRAGVGFGFFGFGSPLGLCFLVLVSLLFFVLGFVGVLGFGSPLGSYVFVLVLVSLVLDLVWDLSFFQFCFLWLVWLL